MLDTLPRKILATIVIVVLGLVLTGQVEAAVLFLKAIGGLFVLVFKGVGAMISAF